MVKDTIGAAPDTQAPGVKCVTRDNVDILVGFGLTPNARVAPVATAAES